MRLEIFAALLERAASEPLGLALETNNPQRLVAKLQEAKLTIPNCPIMVCLPSTPDTVFLVQRSVELDP